MRKGILFFLLVAVVAIAVPAGARAPIIAELPPIVIGDAEDTLSGDTSVRIMKYEDIFDLETRVTWQNGLTDDEKHVFYTTDDADGTPLYLASDGAGLVAPLTTAEAADLALGNDPGAGEVTGGGGFFSFSLINDAINQVATAPITDLEATPVNDNYVPIASYPAGSTGAVDSLRTVTLWAAEVDSFPTDAGLVSAGSDFTVYSMSETSDGLAGSEIVYEFTFDGTDTYTPFTYSDSGIDSATMVVDPSTGDLTVETVDGDSNTNIIYGGWQSSTDGTGAGLDPVVPADGMDGSIFQMAAVVGNDDAATGAACPHFRLGYDAAGGGHQGYVWFVSNANSNLLPTAGSGAQTYYAFWDTPTDLSEYGDGEGVATAGATFGSGQAVLTDTDDARSYILKFDVIDAPGGGDGGTVYLQSVVVSKIPTPATVADEVTFPTDVDFVTAGYTPIAAAQFGFALGQASVSANSMTLGGQASGQSDGYAYVLPVPSNMPTAAQINADPNTLMKMSVTATSEVETMSFWRMVIRLVTSSSVRHSAYAVDQFGGNKIKNWSDSAGGSSVLDASAVPKAAGSTVDTYLFTHTGAVGAFAVPELDAFQINPNLSWSNWNDNLIGTMTVSEVSVQGLSYTP